MDQRTIQMLFALLRSAICGTKLTEQELNNYSPELLQDLLKISSMHDLIHLLAYGLEQNDLVPEENADVEKIIFKAAYRYECLKYEYDNVCAALENAQIPFLPLKGSVIREYYPEPWMRTSCDIDILVRREDLESAISYLVKHLQYIEKERATHDVSLYSPTGIHIELHFDLVEEGRAKNAIDVLKAVWENVTLHEKSNYMYDMTDAYFYFYHIAHMAKHFETGGCGIRPYIDLWIIDRHHEVDKTKRDELLFEGGLLKFANVARKLSRAWFAAESQDELSLQMQAFILRGGVYGSIDNRVVLQQKKNGGRIGYILSRVFIPYSKLKRYYPVLNKHRWLTPFMQIRRWFMLLKPDVAQMVKREISVNVIVEKNEANEMKTFLDNIGL